MEKKIEQCDLNKNNDDNEELFEIVQIELHKHFLKQCITASITKMGLENIQMTILYFIVGSLAMVGELTNEIKLYSIDYVLSQIVIKNKSKGSNFTGFSNNSNYISSNQTNNEDLPHLAATYSALSILVMCDIKPTHINNLNERLFNHYNDTISFDVESIVKEVSLCQNKDGSFNAQKYKSENDVRFTYCALCILKYLGLSSKESIMRSIDVDNCLEYLHSIWSYEGGYSMIHEGESNGGLTYCSIASFILLQYDIPHCDKLIQWLINRVTDESGVTGRTNKRPDSCYSYWIFATLSLLKKQALIDKSYLILFLLKCQTVYGGFSKFINTNQKQFPDLLHTFYSFATLSLLK